jgi:dihydrodipicolinate synthase/N-acetylneuraminate lyase
VLHRASLITFPPAITDRSNELWEALERKDWESARKVPIPILQLATAQALAKGEPIAAEAMRALRTLGSALRSGMADDLQSRRPTVFASRSARRPGGD